MKFYSNDTQDWETTDAESSETSSGKYITYNRSFNSLEEAIEAAKRAAYYSNQEQEVTTVVASVKPVVQSVDTEIFDLSSINAGK